MTTTTIGWNERGEIVYQESECGCIWTDGSMDFCEAHDPNPSAEPPLYIAGEGYVAQCERCLRLMRHDDLIMEDEGCACVDARACEEARDANADFIARTQG